MKKILFFALLTAMLFSCSVSDNEPVGLKAIEVKAAVDKVNMWGNLVLDIPKVHYTRWDTTMEILSQ